MTRTSGRPRGFDTEAALDAALELFWSRGFRSTTTRELEAMLGLSQSSIYNAFGSKQQLLEAVLARYALRISEALIEPLERSVDGFAAIERFLDTFAEFVGQDGRRGCMIVNLMAEDRGETQEICDRTCAYRDRLRSAFVDALSREAVGTEPSVHEARADLLMGVVLGINVAARGGASAQELTSLLNAVRAQVDAWRVG